jgi:hypothetical protein
MGFEQARWTKDLDANSVTVSNARQVVEDSTIIENDDRQKAVSAGERLTKKHTQITRSAACVCFINQSMIRFVVDSGV